MYRVLLTHGLDAHVRVLGHQFYAAQSLDCPLGGVPVVGSACSTIAGAAGSAISRAGASVIGASVGAAFDAAGQWVASGASWLLDQVGQLMSSSTSVGLGTTWFGAHEAVMATLAAAIVLPMALAGAIQAIYRQDVALLARGFLLKLPLAMLLTGVAVELVRLSLSVTDLLSREVLGEGGADARHLFSALTSFLGTGSAASAGVPGFVEFVGALIVAVTALALWLELVVRSAAVAAAALFLPLSMAGLVWPAVSHWCRRLTETLAALVLSKFVVAAVLSLAVGAIAGGAGAEGPDGGGFAALASGIAMLLVAAVSPFTLLKLIPVVEVGAISHLESVRHRLSGAARAPLRVANLAVDLAASAGSPAFAVGAGALSAGRGDSPGSAGGQGTTQRSSWVPLRARSVPEPSETGYFERAAEAPHMGPQGPARSGRTDPSQVGGASRYSGPLSYGGDGRDES